MKALSLTEPWATLVITGEKENETRTWKTAYRGTIAVQAAKSFPPWAKAYLANDFFKSKLARHEFHAPEDFSLGAIIGTVQIVEMIRTEDYARQIAGAVELLFGDYEPGRWVWRLAEPKRLRKPIPCKGALSLWEVPADIEKQILVQN
jgi:hypothetical protein